MLPVPPVPGGGRGRVAKPAGPPRSPAGRPLPAPPSRSAPGTSETRPGGRSCPTAPAVVPAGCSGCQPTRLAASQHLHQGWHRGAAGPQGALCTSGSTSFLRNEVSVSVFSFFSFFFSQGKVAFGPRAEVFGHLQPPVSTPSLTFSTFFSKAFEKFQVPQTSRSRCPLPQSSAHVSGQLPSAEGL